MNTMFDILMRVARLGALKAQVIKIMQSDLSKEEKKSQLKPLKYELKKLKKYDSSN